MKIKLHLGNFSKRGEGFFLIDRILLIDKVHLELHLQMYVIAYNFVYASRVS